MALFSALLAGAVSGLTGFGLALISVPLLLFVYEPRTVIVITAVLSVIINLAVVWDSWRDADQRIVVALLPSALVGVIVGTEVLRTVDPDYIRLGVGIVVVFSAVLLLRDVRLPGAGTRWGTVVAGSTSGALSTSTGLAGPPIVLLLASRGFPKRAFRGSSALYFLAMSLVGLAVLYIRGIFDADHVPLVLALIPAAFLGKAIGTAMLKRISEGAFRVVTLGIVILTGTLGVVTAAWALL
ncbi:MAG: sulfite exporter TauE/SafE family protein [Actinomycetota bacterium]|nr:sulfite exporter TauE/SafE family protein [Actinomycetota bacterium]